MSEYKEKIKIWSLVVIVFFFWLFYSDVKSECVEYKEKYEDTLKAKGIIEQNYFNLLGDYFALEDMNNELKEEIEELEEVCEFNQQEVKEYSLSLEDIYLIAEICEYECGVQCKEGQKAVFTLIMNRLKSNKFPNSVREVIYQKGQFTTAKKVKGKVNEEIVNNILETVIEGYDLPKEVFYFRRGKECTKKKDYKVIEGNVFSF